MWGYALSALPTSEPGGVCGGGGGGHEYSHLHVMDNPHVLVK